MKSSSRELLAIYLNDHLAGATAGARLFRRAARSHRDETLREEAGRLVREVEVDRRTLRRVMTDLGLPVRRTKVVLGLLAEAAGRFKLNGRLLRRSPLSDVVETEAMRLAVEGKADAWRTLRGLADSEPRLDAAQLDRLLDRAAEQAEVLERLHARSVAVVWDGARAV